MGGGGDPGGGGPPGGQEDDGPVEAGDEAIVPFALSGAADAVFREEDHPRAENGQFGSGGGSSTPLDPKARMEKIIAPSEIAELKENNRRLEERLARLEIGRQDMADKAALGTIAKAKQEMADRMAHATVEKAKKEAEKGA